MRIIVPDEIKKLAELQLPYMYYDEKKQMMELRSDAPSHIVEAREKYLDWWKQHQNK